MRTLLRGAALAVLCSLAAMATTGPNGSTSSLTVANANANVSTCTTSSCAQLTFDSGSPAATIFSGADAKISTVGVQLTGTWVATAAFQGSQDQGATWVNLPTLPTPGTAAVLSTTANGNFLANVAGYTSFRVVLTAYTSGTVVVALTAYTAVNQQVARQTFACQVTVSTATTIQAVGGSCVAPGAGLSLYITDVDFATNAAGIAADSFNTLKTGTGGTCGTATAVVWQCMTTAATQATCVDHLITPIKLPANSELCWINSTAGSKTLNIQGYIAP